MILNHVTEIVVDLIFFVECFKQSVTIFMTRGHSIQKVQSFYSSTYVIIKNILECSSRSCLQFIAIVYNSKH